MASSGLLKPGEKGKIRAQVNTFGVKGSLVKIITVSSNDPGRPKVFLRLRAKLPDFDP